MTIGMKMIYCQHIINVNISCKTEAQGFFLLSPPVCIVIMPSIFKQGYDTLTGVGYSEIQTIESKFLSVRTVHVWHE